MLEIRNLSFNYGKSEVLRDISFTVRPGELCALFGPNGAGKTTLFKCLTKILPVKPASKVMINGTDISEMSLKELASHMAYVPQDQKDAFLFPFTVKEMVLMGRTPHMGSFWGPSAKDAEMTVKALETAGISNLAERPYPELSGGQRQLTLLARAFAQDTPVLLLDEPTSNLDFKNQLMIWETIKSIAADGKTALICCHDPNYVLWYCDSAVVLNDIGQVYAKGGAKEVICDSVLRSIYGDTSCVIESNDKIFVLPKSYSQLDEGGE
jgi:iron complex transport system ATP-binding protein